MCEKHKATEARGAIEKEYMDNLGEEVKDDMQT